LRKRSSRLASNAALQEVPLSVRLVFDPRKKSDRKIWERLNEKASQNELKVTEYVRNIVAKHAQ
jgi:ParB family chromosome partitioning protein